MKMKTLYSLSIILALSFSVVSFSKYESTDTKEHTSNTSIFYNSDNDAVKESVSNEFFKKYTDLKKYKSEVMSLYKNRTLGTIWFDEDEINEFGSVLYEKAKKNK